MSWNLLCAQCRRKNPKETSVSTSICVGCNERLCSECSKNHKAIKGFSNHELVLSDSFSSDNFASSHQCNMHPNIIPTWYCLSYHIYLCDECESKVRRDTVSCNDHVYIHNNPSRFALANIKTHVRSELEKIEKTLEICNTSRVENEEDLNNQISEKSLEKDDDIKIIVDECLNEIKSERKSIKRLQQYLLDCKEEFKSHFRSNKSITLSFLMRMSNLKQTIITLYSSLNRISLLPKEGITNGRLERNISPICEATHSIIKSFEIPCVVSLPAEYVEKVIMIENSIVVFTDLEIQRYNSRNQLENKIMVSYSDSAYISKYNLVAILVCEFNYYFIRFIDMDSFMFENRLIKLGHLSLPQSISIIDSTSEFVYFAGYNCAGRVNLNNHVVCVSAIGEVCNSMHVSNNEIFILCGHDVKVYSLEFKFLRSLPSVETLALRTEVKAEYQQCGFQQQNPYNQQNLNNNLQTTCNFISLTCITTDHDNNVYAATDSQGIIRWNCLNNQWERVLTGCHGVRKPFFLCFDDEFANLYVCSDEFNRDPKLILKYKVNLDIVDI